MDAISYSYADKQAKRIKKFIENPDSTSGIVTVPKVIASGETVTVSTGRVAVLPNVQVDGELTVEGEVFIPSGSSVDFSNGIKVNGEKLTMSIPTAYHIYNGSVEATNTVLTNGFSTTLYTGNGGTQTINTGVDMTTQWGDDASEKFGGLVWIKGRSGATSNYLMDTVRGATKNIYSNATAAETTEATGLTAFTSTGFNIGALAGMNTSAAIYASWNFQTTHLKTGVTNHGKAYTEHYNPYTGFTIIKYTGSGLAGHEIPHSLGRKLGFANFKNLTSVNDWITYYGDDRHNLVLNTTAAVVASSPNWVNTDNSIAVGTFAAYNTLNNDYIMYGWANSYYDKNNTLLGNYEIGTYQGTGATGNKITTRGKPAWVMIKRLDAISDWTVLDNVRSSFDTYLNANSSAVEQSYDHIDILTDGFTLKQAGQNASGGQFLYMVVYDNDSGSGKSKYPKATDSTNLTIDALVPYANGIDVNGSKVSIEYKNETITGLTLTQGKNYVYSKNDGTYGVNKYAPMYGSLRGRSVAGENPDYFDLKTMKWYETTGGEELVTNGTFSDGTSGWTLIGSPTLSLDTGRLKITTTTTSLEGVYKVFSTIIGKKYKVKARITSGNYLGHFWIGSTLNGSDILITTSSVSNTVDYEFIAQTTTTYLQMYADNGAIGKYAYFDDITCFELEPTIGAEITPRTYLDCVVYADHNGQVSYVEELSKTTYFDEVKANEFKGKNACTAWANIDMTTTPPTIRDSYGITGIIRTATGKLSGYINMDRSDYIVIGSGEINQDGVNASPSMFVNPSRNLLNTTSQFNIEVRGTDNNNYNAKLLEVFIIGGKN